MQKFTLSNNFTIQSQPIQYGQDLFYTGYALYKDDLYVAKIERCDDGIIKFSLLGDAGERSYCEPHEVITQEDRRAYHAFDEYIQDRKIVEYKSGWCTKTQFWKNVKYVMTDEESKIVLED